MGNLNETSDLFWIHAVLSAVIIPIVSKSREVYLKLTLSLIKYQGVFMMNHFAKVIKTDDEHITMRTLLIRRIPKFKNTKEILINYFEQTFADCRIAGIQLVHNYTELEALETEYQNVLNAKNYCQKHNNHSGDSLVIRPYCLGQLGCCCCCFCASTDALKYYADSQLKIASDVRKELNKCFDSPTGAVFVTFETEKQAME